MKHLNHFSYYFTLCAILSGCTTDNTDDKLPQYKGIFTSAPQHMPNNRTPDGPIMGNGDVGMVLGGNPEDQCFYLSKTDFWKAQKGYPDGGACYIGTFRIQSDVLKGAPYHAEQRIDKALITTKFANNDYQYTMRSWIAATENIAVIELSGGEKPVPVTVLLTTAQENSSVNESGQTKGIYWSVRKFDDPEFAFPSNVAVAMKIIGANDSVFEISNKHPVKILLGFCTNHDKEEYLQEAINKIEKLSEKELAGLKREHESWWGDFWKQSSVNLNDSILEKYYYGSHYLLACCSRNPAFAPGLWGNTLTTDVSRTGWSGDYHLNYNHQAPWWGVYSSNHVELSAPYDTPILEYMNQGREHASTFLHQRGVYYPVGIGPKGYCTSIYPLTEESMMKYYHTTELGLEGGYMFLGQKSNAVFCTANMFMRFYHTYDKEYAEKVYPFIREVADFWEDYLVFENGRYVSYDDAAWEVSPWVGPSYKNDYGDMNPIISLGHCRMLFKGIIDMSRYLDKDTEHIQKWKHILTHLSEIPTTQIDGRTRIKVCEGGKGSGSRTAPGFGRLGMHALTFPSGICGVVTDSSFATILRQEIEHWDIDEKGNERGDSNWNNLTGGFETYFTSAARLGYDGNKLLNKLKERIAKRSYPNLWVVQAGGGIETLSGVPSCINEMLLQGYEGIIRIFPVWPKEKDANFENLRTHGAFLISSSCKDGQVEYVTIVSEKGLPCKIENPWKNQNCQVIRENGKKEIYSTLQFEINTIPGEKIKLTAI